MFRPAREIVALSCTSAILGFAVTGAGHFAMSWFGTGPLGAIAAGVFVIALLSIITAATAK